MITLGLNPYAHDAGVALVRDGEVVFALEEERLNRVRKTRGFPTQALQELIRSTGIQPEDLDAIVVPWSPLSLLRGVVWQVLRQFPPGWRLLGRAASPHMNIPLALEMLHARRDLVKHLGTSGLPRVQYLNHHLAHASNAFFLSPFDRAAILIADGYGDDCSTSTYTAKESSIRRLSRNRFLDSLGIVYSLVTEHLGFQALHDEGTVMALAADGDDSLCSAFRRVVQLRPGGRYVIDRKFFEYHRFGELKPITAEFERQFGPKRDPEAPIEQSHKNLARALQSILEETLLHVARHLREVSDEKNLCIGGGIALNCLASGRICQEAGFERVYVSPAPSDAGQALGGALWASRAELSRGVKNSASPYLGPEYSESEIESALEAAGLKFRRVPDIASHVATCLSEGSIVGWFQGRCETGPRALGNRSLLADSRPPDMQRRLNAIKKRLSFRPFSPAVLEERALEFFEITNPSPYMSFAFNVRPEHRKHIGAVIANDGTARPQLVTRGSGLFRQLIEHFDTITGMPMVLNTSFNIGEPMVCTPEDAIRTFTSHDLDALAIGPFIIGRPPQAT